VVIEKIFEHAHRTPGKIAITYGGRSISYGEFAYWISYARQFLGGHDLRSGSLAVLDLDPLDSWIIGFALRSLGLATISLPTPAMFDELNLRNVGCVITTIHDHPLRALPADAKLKFIQVPQNPYLRNATEDVPELPRMTAPVGGHVLLTSGTTGSKKKVLIDDARLTIFGTRRAEYYCCSEGSMVNVFSFGIWTGVGYKVPSCAWSNGGSVVIHQGVDWHRSLLIDGITLAIVTPWLLSNLLDAPQDEIRRSESMKLFVGGGPLPRALASEAKARLTRHVFTLIASTEAGPWSLTPVERDEDLPLHCIHPSADVQVVDHEDRPLPAGHKGAVRIRSEDSVTGYLDDEDASRAAFRHGYFYSGDLGTFHADGRLALQGRVNNVINVLGNKMAAEAIELALQESLGVDGVCILSMQKEGTDDEFHVVIQSRRPIGKVELASAIRAQLPSVPYTRVRFIDALPRNDTGKIDRAALRQHLSALRAETLA
jgi:fatty-acyl-CoA synthase